LVAVSILLEFRQLQVGRERQQATRVPRAAHSEALDAASLLLDLQQAIFDAGWRTAIDARDLGVDCRNAGENIDKLRYHGGIDTQLLHQRVALGLDLFKLRVPSSLVFLGLQLLVASLQARQQSFQAIA
jgi:hypothetical protein